MDPIEKRELKRKAWMKLAAQRRRAGLLRGRVVIASLLCFAVLWGVVFAQMITGNDPVLSAKEATAAKRTVASAKREVKVAPEPEAETEEPEVLEVEEPEVLEVEEPLATSQS